MPVVGFAILRSKGASDVVVADAVAAQAKAIMAANPDIELKLIDSSVGTTTELDCADGKSLNIGGNNNKLTVKGTCANANIGGADNTVNMDRVDKGLSVGQALVRRRWGWRTGARGVACSGG